MKYERINDPLPLPQDNDVKETLLHYSNLIEDFINIGKHIIIWDGRRKVGTDEDLTIILFFRNILDLGDSISILVKNSSIDPCKPILRSLLENTLGLEYLLKEDTDKRALSFITCDAHQKINSCERMSSGTERGKKFKAALKKDKMLNNKTIDRFFDSPELSMIKKNSEDLLKEKKYQSIEAEYSRVTLQRKQNKERPYEPNWYSLYGGPPNIDQLAQKLNHQASYELIYRKYSDNVHATDLFTGKLVSNGDGTVDITLIRDVKDAQEVTNQTINFLLMTYSNYVRVRLPERSKEYNDLYHKVRKPFQAL